MPADNRISLQKLEVFCKVVELGGVRRAAEDLFVSQPVVSAHLRSLQERVGATLFRRDGRGIALTEAGSQVHLWATDVLRGRRELETTLGSLAGGTAGAASISTSMSVGTYVLPPILIDFRSRFPDAALALHISGVETALEAAITGKADFCVVATDAVLDANAFASELIANPPFSLVAAADDQRVGDTATATEISDLPFVCPPGGMAIRRSQDAALASIGVVNRRVEIELGNAESMKQAIAARLGVGLLWRSSVEPELADGTLREVRIAGADLRDKLFLVGRRGKRYSPLQTRLVESIRHAVAARFPAESDSRI
ncbi:LysR family transcriptional regulator [Pseudonocardia nematodicida]|uniref:LysR family transcriptional regulator n=1 Tax=Pseudonocardia nematodicida TaxID=1206997 RepID=A0ABV1K4T4_9PSEU